MILRPHFDPFTHRRSWQLDIVFTGIVAPLNGINQMSSTYLRHQTAEWTVARLEHFNIVVQNILVEWENLCSMHALCYHVISNPSKDNFMFNLTFTATLCIVYHDIIQSSYIFWEQITLLNYILY